MHCQRDPAHAQEWPDRASAARRGGTMRGTPIELKARPEREEVSRKLGHRVGNLDIAIHSLTQLGRGSGMLESASLRSQ
eukprot:6939453-Pyramimonas_sp.AAC.1